MSSDIDRWLNEGLKESVARETGTNGVTDPPPSPVQPSAQAQAPGPPTKAPKSLSTLGIGRGGVIRNKTTKILTQPDNPVTNPRPSRDQRTTNAKSVPPPDPLSELAATNPALAVPSMFTGMDIDVSKKPQPRPAPAQEKVITDAPPPLPPVPAQAAPRQGFSFTTTIRELLEEAVRQRTLEFNIETERYVISIAVLPKTQASKAPA
jgi:hypothetical protein